MKKENIVKHASLLLMLAAALPIATQAEAPLGLSVVSAASFASPVASGSLATAFGENLAQAAAWATFDSSGNLPTALGGVSVTVAGLPASLLYVSPAQVNFVIPVKAPAGNDPVVLTTSGGATASSTVTVQAVAPAIFNVTCCRSDRGAILNGVTYTIEPFSTLTSENPGSGKATIVTIFGTGWRNATTTAVNLTLSTGDVVPMTVEYAGAAGKYAGLDQINAVVPAVLHNAGLVTVTVTADGNTAIEVTTQFDEPAPDTAGVPPYLISTVAGEGAPGSGAALSAPAAVALDSSHNLYIADTGNHVVRQLSAAGVLTVFAGTGTAGDSGDEGPAAKADLQSPSGLAVDRLNNIYIVDSANNRIRYVDGKGVIHAFAGTGKSGFSGDEAEAISAGLNAPSAIAADRFGNIIISDTGNNRIREVTSDGLIHTLAGNGGQGYSGDGNPAASAELDVPGSVATDAEGTVYFADSQGTRVRSVDPNGNIRTIAGTGQDGNSGDAAGPLTAEFQGPLQLSTDRLNRLWIADAANHRVRMIALDCLVHPLAGTGTSGSLGDGGPATSALLTAPAGMTTDPLGNGWVADSGANNVRLLNFSNGKENCSAAPTLAFSPPVVVGGQSLTGYLELACPASSGETISLSASLAGVVLPASVSLVTGQSIVTFPITTPETSTLQVVSITATGPQGTSTGSFVITPGSGNGPESLQVQVFPSTATGGQDLTGRVTIGSPAPAGGTPVSLSIDAAQSALVGESTASAQVVSQVVIPDGQVSVDFLIQTFAVTQNSSLTLSAKTSFATATAGFELLPGGGIGNQTGATIASLTLNPNVVPGGNSSTGTVTLTSPAATAATILISTTAGATAPASIVMPTGQTTGVFTIGTPDVTAMTTSNITATAANSVSQTLTIEPRSAPGTGEIASLTVNPDTVTGGATSLGIVTLSAPAGATGVTVNLSTTNGASTPQSILIPAGQTTGMFTVSTNPVTSQTLAVITASSRNTVTANLTINPGNTSQGQILSLQINPSSVNGGATSTGTVTLKSAAGTGGVLVTLSSNNGAATVPASIIVASGSTTGTFTIDTKTVTAVQSAVIMATSANSVTATLTINPGGPGTGQIASVSLNPSTVTGGSPSTGTVTLTSAAGSNGVSVTLSSNSASAAAPASLVIAAGQTTGTFSVTTVSVTSQQTATITATSANSSSASLTITAGGPGTGQISSVTLNPTSVTGGATSTGAVTLTSAAGSSGVKVTLSSNNPAGTVPASIIISAGQTTGTFTVSTTSVTSQQTATITATSANSSAAALTINAGTPGTGQISSLTLNPASVNGGTPSTGTVTLTAAAGSNGVKVSLGSNNAAATVPASIIIASGQTSGTFQVATTSVTSQQTAVITATSANSSTASLTINSSSLCVSSANLNVSITNLLSGQGLLSGTVILSGPAPGGGQQVQFLSGSVNLGTITVGAGQTSAPISLSISNLVSLLPSLLTSGVSVVTNGCPLLHVTVTLNGPGTGTISSVTLNPAAVTGGATSTGTVTLTAPAGSTGVLVDLASNNSAGTVPASLTIPAGQTSGAFTVSTTSVTSQQTATITATSANSSSAALTINAGTPGTGQISSVTLNPTSVTGGSPSTGTVTLTASAGSNGVKVTLASNNAAATVPASIIIASGQTSGTFQVTTTSVTSQQTAVITATSANSTSANLTINPSTVCISTLNLNVSIANLLSGQGLLTGIVTLNGPAPSGGQQIQLLAGSVNLGTITVGAGQTTAPISLSISNLVSILSSILTSGVSAVTNGCPLLNVTVTLNGPGVGTISSIAVNPTAVAGGSPSTGTVTLSSPAGSTGVLVALSSNNGAATVPASITIASGQATGTFQVTTSTVTSQQTATITATSANVGQAALTINTATPVQAQIVGLTLNPTSVTGGSSSKGTVTLGSPAGANGVIVTLASNNASATVPASIVIPSDQSSGTFQVITTSPSSQQTAVITAMSSNSIPATLTINPTLCVSGLTLNLSVTNLLNNQGVLTGTVTLNGTAPAGGESVQLVSGGVNLGTVLVPGESSSAPISLSVANVATILASGVNALLNGCPLLNVTVNLSGPGPATIAGLTLNPTAVTGGTSVTGTVTLASAATGAGILVSLGSSSNSATVPSTITIPAGSTTGSFTIITAATSSGVTAVITAASGNMVTGNLAINSPCVQTLALSVNITSILSGAGLLSGTVSLTGPAPAGGSTVDLVVLGAHAGTLGSILIPAGQTSAPISLSVANLVSLLGSVVNAVLGSCPGIPITLSL